MFIDFVGGIIVISAYLAVTVVDVVDDVLLKVVDVFTYCGAPNSTEVLF